MSSRIIKCGGGCVSMYVERGKKAKKKAEREGAERT